MMCLRGMQLQRSSGSACLHSGRQSTSRSVVRWRGPRAGQVLVLHLVLIEPTLREVFHALLVKGCFKKGMLLLLQRLRYRHPGSLLQRLHIVSWYSKVETWLAILLPTCSPE